MTEDINILLYDLERMRDSANTHTINKAISYLHSLSSPVWYIKDDKERQQLFETHVRNCRSAVNSGQVIGLAISIRRWF